MSFAQRPDQAQSATVIIVHQGDCAVSADPDVAFSTVLGSCISTCVRDLVAGVGGMNHFLLPDPGKGESSKLLSDSARYGAFAMERLINRVLSEGTGRKANLEFKVFGGGRINKALSDVGRENIAFVRAFFKAENYPVLAEDVGGDFSRRLMFWPGSGKALVKRLGPADTAAITRAELQVAHRRESPAPAREDIELF